MSGLERRGTHLAVCILLGGCFIRTSVPHSPGTLDSVTEARGVISRTLEDQHGSHAPISYSVDLDQIDLTRNISNPWTGASSVSRNVIRYSRIREIEITEKAGWVTVTLRASNGAALLHVYVSEEAEARRFADAVETMRRSSPGE